MYQGLNPDHSSNTLATECSPFLGKAVAHRAAFIEALRNLAANREGIGVIYTNPASLISYDGTQLVRIPIVDEEAKEPVILVHCEDQPAPLPEICAAILATTKTLAK